MSHHPTLRSPAQMSDDEVASLSRVSKTALRSPYFVVSPAATQEPMTAMFFRSDISVGGVGPSSATEPPRRGEVMLVLVPAKKVLNGYLEADRERVCIVFIRLLVVVVVAAPGS